MSKQTLHRALDKFLSYRLTPEDLRYCHDLVDGDDWNDDGDDLYSADRRFDPIYGVARRAAADKRQRRLSGGARGHSYDEEAGLESWPAEVDNADLRTALDGASRIRNLGDGDQTTSANAAKGQQSAFAKRVQRMAMDGRNVVSFDERFPELARLRRV